MDPIPPSREPHICPLREMLDFPLREPRKGILIIKANTKINSIVMNVTSYATRSVFLQIELPIQKTRSVF